MLQVLTKYAYIYVIVAILVNINNAYTGAPNISTNACFTGDVIKMIVSFINIQPAANLVAREKNILLPERRIIDEPHDLDFDDSACAGCDSLC